MNYKQVNEAMFTALHAEGAKDHQLADFFNISPATVKRRRKEYGLGSNCASNNKGRLAEQLVAESLQAQGLSVTLPAGGGGPYDLLVEGFRVDVKVGQRRPVARGGLPSYQFRLPETRSSFHASKSYGKSYETDTDLLALAVIEDDRLAYLYIVSSSFWKATVTVKPGSPTCEYEKFLDIREGLNFVTWRKAV